MKRQIIFGLSIALVLSFPTSSAAANPISGGKCSISGKSQIFRGKKYTCIKSGKKLIWNSGIKIVLPNQTPAPTPTPSPTKTKEFTEYEKTLMAFQAVSKDSYDAIRQQWPTSSSNITIQYHFTNSFPKFWLEPWKTQAEKSINFYSQLIDKPEIFHIYFLTEKDQKFMDEIGIWNKDNSPTFFQYWNQNLQLNNCEGAAAWYMTRKGESLPTLNGGIAIASNAYTDRLLKECRSIISHESFHAVQDYFLTLGKGNSGFGSMDSYDDVEMPTFREGSAETISYALGQKNFEESFEAFYERFHQFAIRSNELIKLKSTEDVVNYMKLIEKRSASTDAHDSSYLMGMVFYEFMISKFGLNKFLELVKSQNRNTSFRTVFQSVYGFNIDSAYNQASQHIFNALNVLRN